MIKKIVLLILILILATNASAFSPDEVISYISSSNNYLLTGEQAVILSPQTMINYENNSYWVVAGESSGTINIYFPINDKEKKLADGAIKIRELIKTTIVLNRVYELKKNYSVGDWPFSRSNKTNFDTLATKLNDKIASYNIIQTGLENVVGTEDLVDSAKEIKSLFEELSKDSQNLSILIEDGINFEKNYFINPDTNQTNQYEQLFQDYFNDISTYKTNYDILKNKINLFRNEIGSFTGNLEITQKQSYTTQANLPQETAILSSIFSIADETQTFVEEIFNQIKNIENLVLNLNTRNERNDVWLKIYGPDKDITKLNPNISSLSEASQTILDKTNIDLWKDQESVKALQTNFKQTETKYNNGIYTSASEFAKSAKKNVLAILKEGIAPVEDANLDSLLINIIIVLIVVIVGIFLFEKFYLNKKKNNEEIDEYENYK
jgi:hypothetical protein